MSSHSPRVSSEPQTLKEFEYFKASTSFSSKAVHTRTSVAAAGTLKTKKLFNISSANAQHFTAGISDSSEKLAEQPYLTS
ncbi:maker66, partial [Drosophila busckii]